MSTYLITGATRGIGRALVDELAADNLILTSRDKQALKDLCAALPSARAITVDFAQPDSIADAVGAAGLPERLDGIVHAAGVSRRGLIAEMKPAAWAEQLTVNVVAVAELTRYSKRAMAADCFALMRALGYEPFCAAGHDRGLYVAQRVALDHPAAVTRLCLMDGILAARRSFTVGKSRSGSGEYRAACAAVIRAPLLGRQGRGISHERGHLRASAALARRLVCGDDRVLELPAQSRSGRTGARRRILA